MQLPLQLLGRQRPGDGGAAGVEHGVGAQLARPPLAGAAGAGVHPVQEGDDEEGQPQLQLGEQRQQHGPQQHLQRQHQQRPRRLRRRRDGTGLAAAIRALRGLRSRGLSRRLLGERREAGGGGAGGGAAGGPKAGEALLHGSRHGRPAAAQGRGSGRACDASAEGGRGTGGGSRAPPCGPAGMGSQIAGSPSAVKTKFRRF